MQKILFVEDVICLLLIGNKKYIIMKSRKTKHLAKKHCINIKKFKRWNNVK